MRKILIFLSICFIHLSSSSQDFFVRVNLEYKNILMIEDVSMYFKMNPIDSFLSNIENLDSFSEWDFLKLWGLPLINGWDAPEECNISDRNIENLKQLFKEPICFYIENDKYKINISFLKLDAIICTFIARANYWPAYDVVFFRIGAIESYSILKMNKDEKKQLKKIVHVLDQKLQYLDK